MSSDKNKSWRCSEIQVKLRGEIWRYESKLKGGEEGQRLTSNAFSCFASIGSFTIAEVEDEEVEELEEEDVAVAAAAATASLRRSTSSAFLPLSFKPRETHSSFNAATVNLVN